MLPGHTKSGLSDEECVAARDIFDRVGDRWSLYILGQLGGGPVRFNELRRTVEGVSQRMLSLTLRSLERDGLISRTVFPTNPPQVEYALTELGRTLLEPIEALVKWAAAHQDAIETARTKFDQGRES